MTAWAMRSAWPCVDLFGGIALWLVGLVWFLYALNLCHPMPKGNTIGIRQSMGRNAQSEQDSDLQPVAPVGDPGIHVEIVARGFEDTGVSGALSFPLFAPRTKAYKSKSTLPESRII